jgi:hypothetical protein
MSTPMGCKLHHVMCGKHSNILHCYHHQQPPLSLHCCGIQHFHPHDTGTSIRVNIGLLKEWRSAFTGRGALDLQDRLQQSRCTLRKILWGSRASSCGEKGSPTVLAAYPHRQHREVSHKLDSQFPSSSSRVRIANKGFACLLNMCHVRNPKRSSGCQSQQVVCDLL